MVCVGLNKSLDGYCETIRKLVSTTLCDSNSANHIKVHIELIVVNFTRRLAQVALNQSLSVGAGQEQENETLSHSR